MRRLPVYILVDCSASMKGEAIEAVKVGLDKLLSSLRRDPYALEGVYISLIAYSNDADVLVTLTELSDFQLPAITLAESSNRNLGQAIELLCQRYDEEVRKTTSEQKGDWLPFVVMLTGGDSDDEEHIEQILPQLQEHPFAKIIACVAGADKSTRVLRSFTKDIFLLDTMNSHSFSRFWQWVSKITSVQSRSFDQLQEELPPPPPEFNPFYSVENVAVENAVIETVAKLESSPVKKVENPVETPTKPSIDIFEAVKRNDLATVQQWLKIDANLIHAKDKLDDTPLHCAVWNNSVVDILKYLISQGADVNAVTGGGLTPLHRAALNNQQNVEVLKYLITQGADVNAKSMAGVTPIHCATLNSNVEVLKYLILQGADVNVKDKEGTTPLDVANTEEKRQVLRNASITSNPTPSTLPSNLPPPPEFNPFYSNNTDTVETAINPEQPPIKKVENPAETLTKPTIDIFEAVKRNDLSTVQQWLQIDSRLVLAKDQSGMTPLHFAAWNNPTVDICKYLISQGEDVNVKDKLDRSPLHLATCNSILDIVKCLISQGADVNEQSVSGFTSLHYAANNHDLEILKYLISQGADINAKNKYDETPLDFLSTEERKQILDNASKASISPSPTLPLSNPSLPTLPPNSQSPTLFQRIKKFLFFPRSPSNPSPPTLPPNPSPLTLQPSIDIFEAIKQNDLSTVQQWINIDAKLVHAKNKSVGTPLHCAALNNPTVDICQYLISQGADVNAVDNAGCVPLHHATWNVDICNYLISQGANVNAADNTGATPLHHTIWNNSSVEAMKCLISQGADVNVKNRYGKTPLDIANTEEKKKILRNASHASKPSPSTLPPNPLLPPYPYLVVTTYFNLATIWDATTGQSLCHLMHPNRVLSASYSPNGKYILTECRDKLVRIWNAETGYLLHAIKEYTNDPIAKYFSDAVSARFSTDSKCVLIQYSNGNEWLADVTTGKSAGLINKSHMSFISPSRQISHDGRLEIKPGRNHSTLICESNTGKVVCEIKGHKNFVSSAAFSPIDNNHFMAIPIKETQIGCASMVAICCVLGICVNAFPFIIGLVITSLIGIFTDIFVIKKSKSCPKNLSRYWKMLFSFSASFLVIFINFIIIMHNAMNYDISSAWIWFLFGIITGLSAMLPLSVGLFERSHKSKP